MEKKQVKFPGFPKEPKENYWQYPKIVSQYWYQLIGSEQKVLDYILRHTWGYQKYIAGDTISLKQFTHGIRKKNGCKDRKCNHPECWWDRGIGLSHTSVISALDNLEKKEFIETKRDKNSGKPNWCRLKLENLDDNEGIKKLYRGSKETLEGGSKETLHTINKNTIDNNNNTLDTEILTLNKEEIQKLFDSDKIPKPESDIFDWRWAIQGADKRINLFFIGLYFKQKDFRFENKIEAQGELKRLLKISTEYSKKYSIKKFRDMLDWIEIDSRKKGGYSWVFETLDKKLSEYNQDNESVI